MQGRGREEGQVVGRSLAKNTTRKCPEMSWELWVNPSFHTPTCGLQVAACWPVVALLHTLVMKQSVSAAVLVCPAGVGVIQPPKWMSSPHPLGDVLQCLYISSWNAVAPADNSIKHSWCHHSHRMCGWAPPALQEAVSWAESALTDDITLTAIVQIVAEVNSQVLLRC